VSHLVTYDEGTLHGVYVLCALLALGHVDCFDDCICVVVKAGATGVLCLRCWLSL
jgi:hypothetical protein